MSGITEEPADNRWVIRGVSGVPGSQRALAVGDVLMMQHEKPVRRCHGCGLNLGEHCGVYAAPRDMWHHRICPGYGNADLLRAYQEDLAKHRESPRKLKRRVVARARATTPHYLVNLPLAVR